MKFPWYIWIPRALIILLALFMAMFSLDIFETKAGFWQTALGLLMHNIPTLIVLLILLLTWNRPLIGSIVFVVAAVVFSILIFIYFRKYVVFDLLAFALPMLIAALLFYFSHQKRMP
jgi:hypothetical protein